MRKLIKKLSSALLLAFSVLFSASSLLDYKSTNVNAKISPLDPNAGYIDNCEDRGGYLYIMG